MFIAKLDNNANPLLFMGLFNNGFPVLTRGARDPLFGTAYAKRVNSKKPCFTIPHSKDLKTRGIVNIWLIIEDNMP